ncbi:MAG: DNA polymerase III subunit delta [Saprospiraceae bacterium]|nr:DNA polymerase III subunit delta [Saprospiraceae bacterium]
MKYDQILKELKANQYKPVYFLHGNEPYYIDQLANFFEDNILDETEKAFNLTILYGKDIDHKQVVDQARRFPMMASHQVVIIKEAQSMSGLQQLQTYIENPLETTILVICHKHKKFDGRTKLANVVKKNAVLFESKKPYDNQMPAWITSYLTGIKLKIGPKEAALIAEYLGNDLGKVANELDKLAINLSKGHTVTADNIQEHIGISKDYNIFELQDALTARNHTKAYQILKYFQANPRNNPLVMVVAALFGFFSKVYLMHTLRNAPDREVQKVLGLPTPYFVKDYRKAAQQFNRRQTEKIIHLLKNYDLKSKGVGNASSSDQSMMQEMMYHILSV